MVHDNGCIVDHIKYFTTDCKNIFITKSHQRHDQKWIGMLQKFSLMYI